jgi:hypothetical protein
MKLVLLFSPRLSGTDAETTGLVLTCGETGEEAEGMGAELSSAMNFVSAGHV